MEITIRRALEPDVPRMLELVKELALFERAPQEVTVTLEHMRDAGFGADAVEVETDRDRRGRGQRGESRDDWPAWASGFAILVHCGQRPQRLRVGAQGGVQPDAFDVSRAQVRIGDHVALQRVAFRRWKPVVQCALHAILVGAGKAHGVAGALSCRRMQSFSVRRIRLSNR